METLANTWKLGMKNRNVGKRCGNCGQNLNWGDRVKMDGKQIVHNDCANPQK